jgi:hypothetical protein
VVNAFRCDRGKVHVQTALMLGGGESRADIEHLRFHGDAFGYDRIGRSVEVKGLEPSTYGLQSRRSSS